MQRCCSTARGAGRTPPSCGAWSATRAILSASWRDAPEGYPKLLALIGWVQACLCIGGHERRLDVAERHLIAELERQVLDDGGHASRNPGTLVALLLDLLPLRQCFGARGLAADKSLSGAIDRMMPMLRRLRLGDGQLARFNGMGATERDALAMVLAYDRAGLGDPPAVSRSGYVRLQRGATAVVVDAGPAPPLDLAGEACAGCLSFEMSTGRGASAGQRRHARHGPRARHRCRARHAPATIPWCSAGSPPPGWCAVPSSSAASGRRRSCSPSA